MWADDIIKVRQVVCGLLYIWISTGIEKVGVKGERAEMMMIKILSTNSLMMHNDLAVSLFSHYVTLYTLSIYQSALVARYVETRPSSAPSINLPHLTLGKITMGFPRARPRCARA